MKIFPSIILLFSLWSCAKGPFVPVNTGREYGSEKLPWVVSHLPEKNQWTLARTGHHYFLRKILCFDYACRKMIGRRKTLRAISFEKFKKKIKKNARKGAYKNSVPSPSTLNPDTLLVDTPPQQAVPSEPIPVADVPVLKADSLIILNEFLFETNSYHLKENQFSELDSISSFLKTHPTLEVIISGHTDNVGRERYNVELSTHRAEVVAEYLVDKGILYDRVAYDGFGSSRPIADNNTEEGRSKNRRVEILIRDSKK